MGYITISLLVPVLILFIFLSHQEWSLAQSPYHVLDERIPVESIELAQNSYMKAANGKVISEISTGEKRTYLKLEDIPFSWKIRSSLQRTINFMIMQESTYPA
ncbi:hypothetical protein [Peribacillus frigoritolerans]|uniref:hypothetical protein n=1 Tax=Peribacillus castrilensis TaxID=2897690 RepID=UPI002DC51505|nr:hypothetical protein [Peribacillus castrilensis]